MSVVNVRKAQLNKMGIRDFAEWSKMDNTVYIGRNMSYFVPGTFQSKWANPFKSKKHGDGTLQLYESHIRDSPHLMNQITELDGKQLGCWCVSTTQYISDDLNRPLTCHGEVLLKILKETLVKRETGDAPDSKIACNSSSSEIRPVK